MEEPAHVEVDGEKKDIDELLPDKVSRSFGSQKAEICSRY